MRDYSAGGITGQTESSHIAAAFRRYRRRASNPGGAAMDRLAMKASKVPEVTLGFWIIKIAATTLGETGGDSVTMTLNWGYSAGTAIFLSLLVILIIAQTVAKKFRPFLYWATIVASTTARRRGLRRPLARHRPAPAASVGLFGCLLCVLGLWYWSLGSISVDTVSTPKAEVFYWVAITFSQTLGTALGDWMADTTGLGYEGGALVFAAGLAVIAGTISGPGCRGSCCSGLRSS